MFCPRCGNKLHSGMPACVYCKYELDPDDIVEVQQEETKNHKHKKTVIKKEKTVKEKEITPKTNNRNYLLLYLIYVLFMLPIIGVIGAIIIFKLSLFSLFAIIMGILIELILIYFVKTSKNNK